MTSEQLKELAEEGAEFFGLKFKVIPVDKMPEGVLMVMQGKPFQNPDGTWNENKVSLIDNREALKGGR